MLPEPAVNEGPEVAHGVHEVLRLAGGDGGPALVFGRISALVAFDEHDYGRLVGAACVVENLERDRAVALSLNRAVTVSPERRERQRKTAGVSDAKSALRTELLQTAISQELVGSRKETPHLFLGRRLRLQRPRPNEIC